MISLNRPLRTFSEFSIVTALGVALKERGTHFWPFMHCATDISFDLRSPKNDQRHREAFANGILFFFPFGVRLACRQG